MAETLTEFRAWWAEASPRERDRKTDELVWDKCPTCGEERFPLNFETVVPPSWEGHAEGRTTRSTVYVGEDGETRCTTHDKPLVPLRPDSFTSDARAMMEVIKQMRATYSVHLMATYDGVVVTLNPLVAGTGLMQQTHSADPHALPEAVALAADLARLSQ